jgi:hypothetical protein
LENSSLVNVWGNAVNIPMMATSAVVKGNDIVGYCGWLAYNDDWNDFTVDISDNYFGLFDTDMMNKTCEGYIKLENPRKQPFFPKPFKFENATNTWSGYHDIRNVLFVNGNLTINNGVLEGEVVVAGTLILNNVNVKKQGLAINYLPGSSGSINGLTATEGNGSKVWIQSNGISLSNFNMQGIQSSITLRNTSNTLIQDGKLDGYITRDRIGLWVLYSDNLVVRNVEISTFTDGVFAYDLEGAMFDNLTCSSNYIQIYLKYLYNSTVANSTLLGTRGISSGGIWIDEGENDHIINCYIEECGYGSKYPSGWIIHPDVETGYNNCTRRTASSTTIRWRPLHTRPWTTW